MSNNVELLRAKLQEMIEKDDELKTTYGDREIKIGKTTDNSVALYVSRSAPVQPKSRDIALAEVVQECSGIMMRGPEVKKLVRDKLKAQGINCRWADSLLHTKLLELGAKCQGMYYQMP